MARPGVNKEYNKRVNKEYNKGVKVDNILIIILKVVYMSICSATELNGNNFTQLLPEPVFFGHIFFSHLEIELHTSYFVNSLFLPRGNQMGVSVHSQA